MTASRQARTAASASSEAAITPEARNLRGVNCTTKGILRRVKTG
jgi:hypothetical protein